MFFVNNTTDNVIFVFETQRYDLTQNWFNYLPLFKK